MSLTSILNSATSGLLTAQTQLRVISDNIANVNTPSYARKVVDQQSISLSAYGGGVNVLGITRSVNQFLDQASYQANAQNGSSSTISTTLDQAQSLFGDPTASNGFFNQLDQVFSDLSAAAQNPASTVSRSQALSDISGFFSQASSISTQLQGLGTEASSQISSTVTQVNNLLSQIDQLNTTIVRDTATGDDATGAQNAQSALVDQLSSLVDVNVSQRGNGAIDIRSGDGTLLVGSIGASQLSYATTGPTPDQVMVASPGGTPQAMQPQGGNLEGLLQLANVRLPSIQSQLSQYVSQAANAINQAHNAATAFPPPTQLTGRNIGVDLATAISGFTGKTTVSVVDPTGVMQSRIDIDFGAGTLSVDGGAAQSFAPSTFLSTLNSALGGNGSASFNNGVLSVQATGGNGIAIADDPTTPSNNAGRGFSQFFGLNDLITSSGFPYAATGVTGSDANGFSPGGVLTLQLRDANGAALRNATVAIPTGGTMSDVLTALNDNATGVGLYGAFTLSSAGQLTFTPNQAGVTANVLDDTSQWGAGGTSLSTLYGLDANQTNQLPQSFAVRSDIAANPMNLAMAQLDLTATAGQTAISPGDARGGQQLAAVANQAVSFNPAGSLGALNTTLSNYASQLSGSIAQNVTTADSNAKNAQAVSDETQSRRDSVEGVNLDQELINLTTYQQAYNANARLLQTVNQLFQTLLNI